MKKYTVLFLSLFLIQLTCISQTYNFKNYNIEQGLPQSQVLSIYQDHKGFMWFGTNGGGAGKFDGSKFITISDNDGLSSNIVFSITQNHKNEIVLGTSKGISVYNGYKFKSYNENHGLTNSWVFKVLQDSNITWIGTQEGVYILQEENIRRFSFDKILDKASVFSIFIDSKKRIWFGTINDGAICFNPLNNTFTHFNKSNGLQENLVFSYTENSAHEILIGTVGGVSIVDLNNKIRSCDYIPNQFNVAFRSLITTTKNEQWLGSASDGLYKYSNGNVLNFNLLNGLTFNSIMCLYNDKEGNVWMGTDGSGAYKYLGAQFTSYSKQNGLPENYVNAVAQDINGAYWVALRNSGLSKIDGKKIENFKVDRNKPNDIPDNNITSILPLPDGRIFFGTLEGLCIYEKGKFKTITDFDFRKKYILSLFLDSKKNIWIGTTVGIFKYKDGIITEEKNINSLKQEGIEFPIFSIVEDKNSAIWAGTEHGLIKYHNNSVTFFSDKNGFTSRRVSSSIIDKDKNLWFGTEEGLYNYDYKSFSKISQKNGLFSNNIWSMQIDNHNRLIIGLSTGIDILDITDYYQHKIKVNHFGKDDGLFSLENNFNAIYKDKNGRILIGTIDGLEIYDPKFDRYNQQEAVTNINSVKLFFGQEDILKFSNGIDSTSLLPQNLQLPFNKNHITFQFIGISLTAPEKVMYQYKLEGLDDNWTPPTSKTEATYSSLPPGKYRFLVKAMNNDGLWNKEPQAYEFTISPPWYNTWWFYTLCAITLIAGIWLYNYMHTKKLIADKQKLEGQVAERTKELREEKEKVEIINKEVIEQKTVIEHHNMEIMDSIKYAKNIQEALLPSLNEIDNLFENCFVLYMPKDIVSGDFYWFAKNGDTRFIAAVDCTGHGVPGAFMSIVGNTLLNEIVNEKKITVPGDILLELHKGVKIALNQNAQEFERRDGMDITLCAFKDGATEVQYAGANRPLWIYRNNTDGYELEAIKATKYPIGGLELEENRIYQNHIIPLNSGDCLYLFSDGYADQFGGPKGKKFMLTNLQKTLLENISKSMPEQKQSLTKAFMDWKNDAEQIDDVLVIGIKIG